MDTVLSYPVTPFCACSSESDTATAGPVPARDGTLSTSLDDVPGVLGDAEEV